jgi:hypothetical protein
MPYTKTMSPEEFFLYGIESRSGRIHPALINGSMGFTDRRIMRLMELERPVVDEKTKQ